MKQLIEDVTAFHIACDVPIPDTLGCISDDRKQLRISLIEEEVNKELLPAMHNDDILSIADGIADSIYVLVGAALEYGIPLLAVYDLVHTANMAKIDPKTGKVNKRIDGKILKPDGWKSPDTDIAILLGV